MSGYPRNLSYFVRKLNNYSRNTFKLQTLNQSTASASQIITVDLPNNALVDLNTLSWYFEGTCTGTGGAAQLPRNIESIIERVEVEVNGQLVSGGCASYNQLWNILADTTFGDDVTNRRRILQNATEVGLAAGNLPGITGAIAAGNIANQAAVPFTITNWLGFLGSCKPEVLDTNLLGNVRVRITLAPTSVCVFGTNTTAATYSLANMYFSVDTISIDDGNFYSMHEQFLSKGGVYEIPFNNYYSFSQTSGASGALKFSLSTQSLNMVWATFVNGAAGTPSALDTNIASSSFFRRSGAGSGANGDGMRWQFNINNVYYPNYQLTNTQAYQQMLNAYGLSQDTLGGGYRGCDTLTKWNGRYWVAVQSFCHNTADDERFISGIDTRGNVAQAFFEYSGFSDSATCTTGLVFAQTTSLLRVGAGRQIEVVM